MPYLAYMYHFRPEPICGVTYANPAPSSSSPSSSSSASSSRSPRRGVLAVLLLLLLAVASFHPLGAQKMPAALSILIFLDPGATPAPVGSAVGRAPFGKRAGALLLLLPRLVASPPPE